MMNNMDKEQKIILKISLAIALVICTISLIIFLNRDAFAKKGQFVVPEMDLTAINGKPDNIPKEYMYQEAKVNNEYIVYLCAIPTVQDKELTIYFTSINTNKGLMKIKVLDSKNNVIGESGLINPDSYIKSITLNKDLKDQEQITIKVMHYEKETYYSLGGIKLDVHVRKIIN